MVARPNPSALSAALKYLHGRERFEREVRNHLVSKGFDSTAVEDVVQFLVERKLINDRNTTQNLIERSSGKRSVGTEKLRAELERLGASPETVESGLAAIERSEPDRAFDALQATYKPGVERAKAGRFLDRRGFSEEAIESALDRFCGSATFPE